MRFPPSFLDEIRARLPISAVVGRKVTWDRRKSQPAKGDFWACCPFHQEKTASFHCDDRKGIYHCFGCGVTGDHFRFLTEREGLSFPEAVAALAAEAGLAMPASDPAAEARERERESLHEVLERAARFFEQRLASRDGAAARAYLDGRRIGPAIQRRFRIGFAPDARNALREHLADAGIGQAAMIEAGLLVAGDDIPVAYDRFRNRIIFPIADFHGRIVGFGGRALSPDMPAKYLNSPETTLFRKGELLYNAAAARTAIRDAGTVIVVEGYVDAIALSAAGFGHVVAPLGTALTERQLDILWRLAPEPVLCFDGDAAGQRAARRAIDIALPRLAPGRSLRFAILPEGQDPDDLIGAGGAEAFRAVLDGARPLIGMIWAREAESGVYDTPERRAELEMRFRDIARQIAEPSVRRHYEQAFAERIAAFFAPAGGALPTGPRWPKGGREGAGRGGRRTPAIMVSDRLRRQLGRAEAAPPLREVVLVLTPANHPALLARHFDDFAGLELASRALDSLRREVLEIVAHDPGIDGEALRRRLTEDGLLPLLDRLDGRVRQAGAWQALAGAATRDAEDGWLQAMALHRKSRSLHKELKDAEVALAAEQSDENLARFLEIKSLIAGTDGTEALIEGFGASSGRRAGRL